MASCMFFQFDASCHAVVNLLVLVIRKGSTVEVAKGRCQNCSSKLCLSFGPFETRSVQQMRLCKNYMFGTASFQLPLSQTATE